MPPVSTWCAVSNAPVPGLARLARPADLGDLHVYYRGPEGAGLPDGPPFTLDVRTLAAHPDSPDKTASDVLRIDADAVTIRVSTLSEDPVYYAVNRVRGLFAYFTDLLLAPLLLPALGMPVAFTGGSPTHERGTLLLGVNRLRYGILTRTRRVGRTWLMEARDEPDPLVTLTQTHRDDALAAGEAQLHALTTELRRIAATAPRGTGYATVLSGGIEAATVTCLAVQAGLPVTAYGLVTDRGEETVAGAGLCARLGVGLEPLELTEDRIIAAIPEAVRWLGSADPDTVDGALLPTAVRRLGAIPPDRILLTGHGSDPLNAGPHGFSGHREGDQYLTAVDRARRSNAYSHRMSLAYGSTTHHPFWSWPVIRTALETAPRCKAGDGHDAYHLRTAMAARLTGPPAWRGTSAAVALRRSALRRLAADTGVENRERLYLACFEELVDRAAAGELEPTDPQHLLEGALRRARAH